MPTIELPKSGLEKLLKDIDMENRPDQALSYVKGEIEPAGDIYRVEIADTNRPDLYSLEGIARELKGLFKKESFSDDFLHAKPYSDIRVQKSIQKIRPYVGGFLVEDLKITEEILLSIIDIQEKLCQTLGRNRKTVAIGIYDARNITFPITYGAFDPKAYSFTPLEFDTKLMLSEIIKNHPKGQEYAHLLSGFSLYPLLIDSKETILSLPPIINSREAGEVMPGTKEMFVEATGTVHNSVVLALNIIAAALSLRKGTIKPCRTIYPYSTPLGTTQITPRQLNQKVKLNKKNAEKLLGTSLTEEEIDDALFRLHYRVSLEKGELYAIPPFYRGDVMHPYDLIEDIAIVKGYDNFAPCDMEEFTIGSVTRRQECIERVRDIVIGLCFEEIVSNILTSPRELCTSMEQPCTGIEIENPISETYSVLRNWMIPSLLKVESLSRESLYPHRIFEIGDIVLKTDEPEEELHLGVLIAHNQANFTEVHQVLQSFSSAMRYGYNLKAISHHAFIPGRCGEIRIGGEPKGIIGEIHPQILSNWGIKAPVSVLEISLEAV